MKIRLTLKTILSICAVMIYFSSTIVTAFDANKEQRIAEQTLQTLFVGEPLWLNTKTTPENTTFLSLLTEVESTKGNIILIHGTGLGPDTPFVIGPLRELLSDEGYTTLALQMPVLSDGKVFNDYKSEYSEARNRISAAINHFKNNSEEKIILLAHSLGSTMMMDWVDNSQLDDISSFISLGLGTNNMHGKLSKGKLNIPLLDIVGENDYENVLSAAKTRREDVFKTDNKSKQVFVAGLDHFYTDNEEMVVEIITNWLKN